MTSSDALIPLVRGLLEPLLDARLPVASARFDEVLAGAVTSGRITPELARELRLWQRASVHEVTDHVRTVLPVVLPVALTAVAEANEDADEAVAGAVAAWQGRTADPQTAVVDVDAQAPVVGPVAGEVVTDVAAATDDPSSMAEASGSDAAAATEADPQLTPLQDSASMTPHVRRRLFVAGLTSTA